MRTICDLTDDAEFLGTLYRAGDAVANLAKETGIVNIVKRKPTENQAWTEEERVTAYRDQAQKNLSEALRIAMCEKPYQTGDAIRSMVLLDKGEQPPTGFKLTAVAMRILSNEDVVSFFTSAMQSGLMT